MDSRGILHKHGAVPLEERCSLVSRRAPVPGTVSHGKFPTGGRAAALRSRDFEQSIILSFSLDLPCILVRARVDRMRGGGRRTPAIINSIIIKLLYHLATADSISKCIGKWPS